ncbi:MAG TPA: alpha/beta hydrolase [Spirochaetota bacterium]|nr:alpha/beta hydrolase [Spirochaetota bacterium]
MKWTKRIIIVLAVIFLSIAAFSFIFPEKLYMMTIKGDRAGLVIKEVQAGDHKITYLEGGEGAETLVLIHGFSADKDNWPRMAGYMPGYQFVIPDLPGFGDSTKSEKSEYNVTAQVERLDAFFTAIGLKKFYIAGNSMGGNISGIYAAKYPQKIKGLILLDNSGMKFPVESPVRQAIARGINPLLVSGRNDYDRFLGVVFVKPPFIPLPVKWFLADKAIASREFNSKVFREINTMPALIEDNFDKLTMPVLIIWGDKDMVLDVSGVTVLEKGIKNHTTHILKDCGHVPMIERPEETAGYIKAFIEANR